MKIGIVGLGAAGLRTAMLLEQQGHDVLLYEARERLGGRIHTFRREDVVFDAGGEWLDSDHHRTLSLLSSLGIEPERSHAWPGRVLYDGNESREDILWPDALEDDLRFAGAAQELCRNLNATPWRNRDFKDLDHRTLASFVEEHCRTERGRWWVNASRRSDEGDDLDRIGLLGWLCGYLLYLEREGDSMSAFRVAGGMDRLVAGMAAKIKATPNLMCILQRVNQDSEGVTLQFETFEVRVDKAVITLPPPVLERVVFDPSLSGDKRCAVEACGTSRAIKICWQFDKAWWKEEGWNGRLMADSPIQQIWDGSQGEAPILNAYICGDQSLQWMKHDDPVRASLKELSKIAPKAAEHFVQGWVFDWNSDPFSKGAFSNLAPGYVLDHMQHIGTPEGLIHFAGEHTARWIGFIEGALESAERVSEEIGNA